MINRYEFEKDIENFEIEGKNKIEIINFVNDKINRKTQEEIIADVVFFNMHLKEDEYVPPFLIDEYTSDYSVNATVKYIVGKDIRTIKNYQLDVNFLSPNAIIRFCAENKSLDLLNYISNRVFFGNDSLEMLNSICEEYTTNPISFNIAKSALYKLAAKQYLYSFDLHFLYADEKNEAKKIYLSLPQITNFSFDEENKKFVCEKAFYENDKRKKIVYQIYRKNQDSIINIKKYELNSAYTLIEEQNLLLSDRNFYLTTTTINKNNKAIVTQKFQNRNLVYAEAQNLKGENHERV